MLRDWNLSLRMAQVPNRFKISVLISVILELFIIEIILELVPKNKIFLSKNNTFHVNNNNFLIKIDIFSVKVPLYFPIIIASTGTEKFRSRSRFRMNFGTEKASPAYAYPPLHKHTQTYTCTSIHTPHPYTLNH